ncbi:Dabb family protein [Flagellimonas flava]|uniref:Stress responsive A/B Barrel Domain n=1 Tax=Flagellimonas flava TaxID=570519 RepID=A0A1M5Q717_9FLAO|nr:Dabb family protein [Allomuricauda flava]SHH09283.1 Stress responsive A/B Barrel Domain [Allomuricauda flava]
MNKGFIYIFLIFCCSTACQKRTEFHHVLLYTWSEVTETHEKEAFLELFENLPSKIEGLENVSIAKVENSVDGHDVVVDMTFQSKTFLKNYQNHPNHQKIEHLADKIIRDYSYFQYALK